MFRQSFPAILFLGLLSQALLAQPQSLSEGNIEELIRPTSGLWWNPDEPGTGISLEFSAAGPWFGALYLYNPDGTPVFVTLQGNSLDYAVNRQGLSESTAYSGAFILGVYAVAEGTVNSSSEGLCLGCDWQQPNTGVLNVQATIEFFDLDLGLLTLRDSDTNEVLIQQQIEPFIPGQNDNFVSDSSYSLLDVSITLLGNDFAHQAGATADGFGLRIYFTGQYGISYDCLDNCSETIEPVINNIDTFCMFGVCQDLAYVIPPAQDFISYSTFTSPKRGLIIGVMDKATAIENSLPTQIIIDSLYR